ncbi:MAG: nucleotidyltransferase domain-containing protein [Lachnospiraceae bacterium]|nr:nucleotidyltransferase domain-containing protein [Lachnospiraceae bacterium]
MMRNIQGLLERYTDEVYEIYGKYLRRVILYGSYARGDYNAESDIDIMILLNLSDMEIKNYRHQLSNMTYDFNMDNDLDIKPIAKSEAHFLQWMKNYPFYADVNREGECYMEQHESTGTQRDLVLYGWTQRRKL